MVQPRSHRFREGTTNVHTWVNSDDNNLSFDSSNFLNINLSTLKVLDIGVITEENTFFPLSRIFFFSLKPRRLWLLRVFFIILFFNVPFYILYPHVQTIAGCFVYVRNDVLYFRAHNTESPEGSTIRLRLQWLNRFICDLYFSTKML